MKVKFWLPWITLITITLSGCGQVNGAQNTDALVKATQTAVAVASVASPLVSPSVSDGKAVFNQYCATCHDINLQTTAKVISSAKLQSDTPKQLFNLVTNGLAGQGMPGFSQLSLGERWDVVSYLSVRDFSEDDKRSAKLTYQNMCLSCHGSEGQGDGAQAISQNLTMSDWQGAPLMADYSDQELFNVIRSGVGHDMNAYAVMLSEAQIFSLTKIVRLLSIQEPMNFSPQTGVNQNNDSSPVGSVVSEGFFVIAGNVINASGGLVNYDREVQLKVIDNGQVFKEMTTPLLSDGTFRFILVPYHPNWTYVATFSHNGISFRSNLLYGQDYVSSETARTVILVYDTTGDTSVLRGERAHILLNFTQDNLVHVVEYLLISNLSSYVVAPVNDQYPLLNFTIPATAQNLKFSDSTEANYVQLLKGGFGDWQPIPPGGVHQVMFEYDLPFKGDNSFGFTLPVATNSILVMVQDRSNQISCKGPMQLSQKSGSLGSLDLFSGTNISAGGQLNIYCYNKNELFPEIMGILSLVFVLIIIGVIVLDVRKKRIQQKLNESSNTQRTEVLDAIITLDDRYKAGELSAEVYKQKRQELLKKIGGE